MTTYSDLIIDRGIALLRALYRDALADGDSGAKAIMESGLE